MPPISFVEGTEATVSSEWSLPRDAAFDSGQPQTDDALVQAWIDFGDVSSIPPKYRWRIYEKVYGTSAPQRLIAEGYRTGEPQPITVLPALVLAHGWDITLQGLVTSGTPILGWSIRKVTGGLTIVDGSATISTTTWSLPRNAAFDVALPQTDDALLQAWIDFGAMTNGDVYEVRFREKVTATGSQFLVTRHLRIEGAQRFPLIFPMHIVGNGWDMTIQKLAGTDRTIGWSLRKVA